MIRQIQTSPTLWHTGWGAAIPKFNGHVGPRGLPLIHRICPFSKALFAYFDDKAERNGLCQKMFPHHFGCLPKRRREGALLVQLITAFRLRKEKISQRTMFFDLLNPSPALSQARLDLVDEISVCSEDRFLAGDIRKTKRAH